MKVKLGTVKCPLTGEEFGFYTYNQEEEMKVEKTDEITQVIKFKDYNAEIEARLYQSSKRVSFLQTSGGERKSVTFDIEKLKQLLPHLQRAVDENTLEIPPKYRVVQMDDKFAVKRLRDGLYYKDSFDNVAKFDEQRPHLFFEERWAKQQAVELEKEEYDEEI